MNIKAFSQALLCVILWGITFPLAKYILLSGITPLIAVTLRFLIGGLLFIWFVPRPPSTICKKLSLLTLTLFTVPISITTIAIKYVDASIASLIAQLDVPFALILANLLLKEKITSKQLTGVIISFGGLYLIVYSPEVVKANQLWSIVALVFVSFLYGWASIQIKQIKLSAATITVWSYLLSAPITFLAAIILDGKQALTFAQATATTYFCILLLSVITVLAFWLWSQLLQSYDISQVVAFLMLIPISAIITGYFILDEVTHWVALIGGGVTILGVILQLWRR